MGSADSAANIDENCACSDHGSGSDVAGTVRFCVDPMGVPSHNEFDRAPSIKDSELTYSVSVPSGKVHVSMVSASTQTFGISRPPRALDRQPSSRAGASARSQKRRRPREDERPHNSKWHVNLCSSQVAVPKYSETPVEAMRSVIFLGMRYINFRGSGCCTF